MILSKKNTNENTCVLVQGDVRGTDSGVSMTAFCLIAMQESRQLCDATVGVSTCPSWSHICGFSQAICRHHVVVLSSCPPQSLPESIDKAVSYLEGQLPTVNNPYAVAMTSYALANEKKLNRDILFKFAPGFVSNDLSFPSDSRQLKFTYNSPCACLS